jgi:hypothetical protein
VRCKGLGRMGASDRKPVLGSPEPRLNGVRLLVVVLGRGKPLSWCEEMDLQMRPIIKGVANHVFVLKSLKM